MMTNTGIIETFFSDLERLSQEGGWIFWALIILAFGIVFSMTTIWTSLNWRESAVLKSSQWKRLFSDWEKEPKLIQTIRHSLAKAGPSGMEEIEQSLFAKARRRFPFAFVLIGTAPLVGLLGTVSGMMNTFHGMASASVSSPIETISKGISEALITTQTGLIIAVPSFVVCTLLKSRFDQCVLAFRRIEAEVLNPKGTGYRQ